MKIFQNKPRRKSKVSSRKKSLRNMKNKKKVQNPFEPKKSKKEPRKSKFANKDANGVFEFSQNQQETPGVQSEKKPQQKNSKKPLVKGKSKNRNSESSGSGRGKSFDFAFRYKAMRRNKRAKSPLPPPAGIAQRK